MTPVLASPSLPTLEELKPYIQSEIQKGIEKLENEISFLKSKISDLEAENQDLRATLNDTQILLANNCKKVTVIENTIFSHSSEGELILDENDNPVLSHNLTVANGKPEEPEPEVTPIIETTLDQKTCAIVEYLKTEARPNEFGNFVIDRKELETFMQETVKEELRVKKVSRQLKADIFERAVKLFPGIVYIQRSKSGNKTKMLALKESAKRTLTHGLTRKAPLGILV